METEKLQCCIKCFMVVRNQITLNIRNNAINGAERILIIITITYCRKQVIFHKCVSASRWKSPLKPPCSLTSSDEAKRKQRTLSFPKMTIIFDLKLSSFLDVVKYHQFVHLHSFFFMLTHNYDYCKAAAVMSLCMTQ